MIYGVTGINLIGGEDHTFLGIVIGGDLCISNILYVLFLFIAGGALVYVSMFMYNSGRKLYTNNIMIIVGIFFGLFIDLLLI